MPAKVIAKSVVLNDAGKVLLIRRSATDTHRAGEWDFPGGSVEPGEEPTTGAVREIAEEAGLRCAVPDMRLVYAATEWYESYGTSVTWLLYVCRGTASEVRLSFEHDEFKWVDIDTALRDFPHPFYGVGLRYARDHGLL